MKKSLMLTAFAITAVLFLLASCSGPGGPGVSGRNTGALYLDFSNAMAKSVLPPIPTAIAEYIVSGSGPGGATFGPVSMGGSGPIVDLLPGAWTVTVVGRNSGGVALGEGSGGATVVIGQSISCPITVTEYTGDGSFLVNIAWEPDIVTDPIWLGTLKDFPGVVTDMVINIDLPTFTADSTTLAMHEGWYTNIIRLFDAPNGIDGSEVLTTGRAQAVRILAGYQSVASMWFHAVQDFGVLDIEITTDMHDEIVLTGTPAFSDTSSLGLPPNDESTWVSVYNGTPMDFSVSAGETITPIYYWQGEQVQVDGTYTLDPSALLDDEHYVLDVVSFSVDGKRAGSESWIVKKATVLPTVTISVDGILPDTLYYVRIHEDGNPTHVIQDTINDPTGGTVTIDIDVSGLTLGVHQAYAFESGGAGFPAEWYLNSDTQGAATDVTLPPGAPTTLDFGTLDFTF